MLVCHPDDHEFALDSREAMELDAPITVMQTEDDVWGEDRDGTRTRYMVAPGRIVILTERPRRVLFATFTFSRDPI